MSQLSGWVERRSFWRGPSFLGGIVLHGNAWLTTDCTVRNLTRHGARVRLAGQERLSKPIILLVLSRREAFEAEVIWILGREVGLRFRSQCDLDAGHTDGEKIALRLLKARQG
jgi:hypothetical protein